MFLNGSDHPNLIISTHRPDACADGVFRFDDRGRENPLIKSKTNSLSAVPILCTDSVFQSCESTLPEKDGENDQNADDLERLRERSGKLFGKLSGKASKPEACSKSLGRRSRRAGLIVRGTTYYVRLSVPKSLHGIVGRKEFVRSLGTGRCLEAARKARIVAADFERWLTSHIEGAVAALPPAVATEMAAAPSPASFAPKPSGKTLREVCEVFLSDPTKNRSAKAASSYWNAVEIAEAVQGKAKVITDYDRQCARDIVAMLKWIPSNAKKRFPKLDYRQAAEKGRTGRYPLLSAKSVNDYIIKLSTLLNFAINEGWVDRNPFRGLQLNDDVHPRDKRHPFSNEQLNRIFNAPLYRGCQDDEAGYATPGNAHPRRGRFWIPLIALYSGMRLNEICQLDVKDVVEIEGISCFSVNTECIRGRDDKKLKTMSSRRIVPVHAKLIEIGFMDYVADQRRKNGKKLFPELTLSTTGYYSDPFSKWFARFLKSCGANCSKTSFHSFRHCFRDALREAKVEHEIGLTLGGWTSVSGRVVEIATFYGKGHGIKKLKEAIDLISYDRLNHSHPTE